MISLVVFGGSRAWFIFERGSLSFFGFYLTLLGEFEFEVK
jgi:hypothetical protein